MTKPRITNKVISLSICGALLFNGISSCLFTQATEVNALATPSSEDTSTPFIVSQPATLLEEPPVQEVAVVDQLAEHTWNYLHSDWATDNHLPWSWRSETMAGGDYANPAEIGFYALSWLAAYNLQQSWSPNWITTESEINSILDRLRGWQTGSQTYQPHGPNAYNNSVFYQWYWITTTPTRPEPVVGNNSGDNHLVPSVDNAWLAASLITIREYAEAKNYPVLAQKANAILSDMDFTIWYHYDTHRFSWGAIEVPQDGFQADYYSNENRIINFVARALGQLSAEEFQLSLNALKKPLGFYDGLTVESASWDGSYFTYAGPALFICELDTPYGWNTIIPATRSQISYAGNQNYSAWGLSDSFDVGNGNYVQQGSLPVDMPNPPEARAGLVTPHASVLALITPLEPQAIANLQNISSTFACAYDPLYGFRDSIMAKPDAVDYSKCSARFSALAQEWIFLSLANQANGMIWNYFYRDAGVSATHAEMYDPTWTLVWNDEFNDAGAVDTTRWDYDTGTGYPGGPSNWGTGEVEEMTNSTNNVFQSDGNLNIRALHTGSDINPIIGWTSGRIETDRTDFQPPPGGMMAVEARIQLPQVNGANGQGYWPAFWMLGAPYRGDYNNWPGIGEIDIMENINGLNQWWGTLHCGTNPGGPCNETTGIGGSVSGFSPTLQNTFHTYRMELDRSTSPEQIRWYVDGAKDLTVYSNQVDTATWENAIDHGFFIILNVAIGGGWPGNPTESTISGGTMLVDYVRVYYLGVPIVHSILRTSPTPLSAPSVDFTVTFSEPVIGVDMVGPDFDDFTLTKTGVLGATISEVSGTGSVYTVTVNTGSGNGTLRLDVPVSATITDLAGNPLSGLPFITGETYTVNKSEDVYIGGTLRGSYFLAPSSSTRQSYAGVNTGPVKIASITTPFIDSIRVLFGVSYSEMMGFPANKLTTDYWFPYYNNVAMDSQLRVSNVGGSSTTITVTYGNNIPLDSYTLAAGAATRKNYAGINSGPLHVTSSASNILTTIRVLYGGLSYSELMGFPNNQLTTDYWFPYYNNVAMDSQLRVSNVGGSSTTITVTYGNNIPLDSYTLAAGAATRKNYPGINSGPLHVTSSASNILTTIRVLYGNQSYSELSGYPANQLTKEYVYPVYDNKTANSQLRVSNVGGVSTLITVTYGNNIPLDSYTLAAGAATRKNYTGVNNGPLHVVSSASNILSTQRLLYTTPSFGSFYELTGFPTNQLTTDYYFPWYNNVAMSSQLRIAVP